MQETKRQKDSTLKMKGSDHTLQAILKTMEKMTIKPKDL